MAEIPWKIGLNVGVQSALGTINTTIRDSTAINEAAGCILGDPEAGEGESGINVQLVRSLREKADVSGSFTTQPSDFLAEAVEGFSVAFPLKGNGGTASTPVVDTDCAPLNGVIALLEGLGLDGAAWGSGVGWAFLPNNAGVQYLTCKLFVNDLSWVFMDCAASGNIVFTPREIAVVTANISVGSVNQFAEGTWPGTVDYGTQATLSAPTVAGVNHTWAQTRGFSEFTLNIENTIEEVPDSNAANGFTQRMTDRNINADVVMLADTTDEDYEHVELVKTTNPSDLLSFTLGDAATDGSVVNAVTVKLMTPEARAMTPRKIGANLAWEMSLRCVGTSADSEFELIFI